MAFKNRSDAGRRLAEALMRYRPEAPVVLGLPRGGVPVAFEVAQALEAPLDVWVVRKVGAPFEPEYGLGAAAELGLVYLDRERMAEAGVRDADIEPTVERKKKEVEERVSRYRKGRAGIDVRNRTVILVNDGIATGGTMRAAIGALKLAEPSKIVLAVPVAATQSLDGVREMVDEVVCLEPAPHLMAIGSWYEDFGQTTDEDVEALLDRRRAVAEAPPTDWALPP